MKKSIRRGAAALFCMLWLSAPVLAAEPEALVPVGRTVGLELYTDGVYVVGFDERAEEAPAKDAGMKPGDRIVCVDGKKLTGAGALRAAITASEGRRITLEVERGSRSMSFSLSPANRDGAWCIGVFVQDRITGLGTVTFYDPQTGLFGALGHGVGRGGTAGMAALRGGLALPAQITGVQRGTQGHPGQLQGELSGQQALGLVETNSREGIFGHCSAEAFAGRPIPVAGRAQITTGPAEIWSNVSGDETLHFSAEIEAIRFGTDDGRNLRLRITDERLLNQTGGIVQGMSGSPIIQNGRLVGAVTHVLIQDPSRGYGIWIENMLSAVRQAAQQAA